jgi:hypothetical protein
MLEFVRKNFRRFFVFTLWFILISGAISGFIAGGIFGYYLVQYRGDNPIYGAIVGGILGCVLGLLLGLLYIVLFGGLTAIFLKMDANLQKLVDREDENDESEYRDDNHPFKDSNNTEMPYEIWKTENPDKTINDYYASKRK